MDEWVGRLNGCWKKKESGGKRDEQVNAWVGVCRGGLWEERLGVWWKKRVEREFRMDE